MMRRIDKLARKFELTLSNDEGNQFTKSARGKTQVSRKKLVKQRDKSKKTYQQLRSDLSKLEAQREKLDNQVSSTRKGLLEARSDMLKANDVLRNMDLVDCNYVMYYNNSEDVAYVVDKVEHHLHVDDDGSPTLTPMKEHRSAQRARQKTDSDHEEEIQLADDGEDTNDSDDGLFFDVNDAIDLIPGIGKLDDPAAPRSEEEFVDERYPSRHPNLRFGE